MSDSSPHRTPPTDAERELRELRELADLHRRAARLLGPERLGPLLQRVSDEATDLFGARYGALSVQGGEGEILEFVFTGLDHDHALLLHHPPRGRGLLGVPLLQGDRLRVDDIPSDPRSAGFPDHHPAMGPLLAVPVLCDGPFRGNLYLAQGPGGPAFGPDDEERLTRFAEVAATAIDASHQRERNEALAVAEERLRLAREMHDGVAQVLAYVNAKAQAVSELVRSGQTAEAEAQMDELAAAAREVYAQVREEIVALRSNPRLDVELDEAIAAYATRWRRDSRLELELDLGPLGDARLAPQAELQVLRIVQEALANVRKHARATKVTVRARQQGRMLEAEVADDGIGFDPEAFEEGESSEAGGGGYGLSVMRERAQAAEGTLEIASRPGEGTCITVRVPVAPSGL